jgi:hypothetical protein
LIDVLFEFFLMWGLMCLMWLDVRLMCLYVYVEARRLMCAPGYLQEVG